MMKKLALLLMLSVSTFISKAQYADYTEEPKGNFGFGFGLGYGGIIGGRLSVLPEKHIALFAGLGYNLQKAGINVGGIVRFLPDKKVTPTFISMYGYNSVIVIKNAPQYTKTYYGPSFGGGLEVHLKNGQNFLNMELVIPVRSQKFRDDMKTLKNNSTIVGLTDPLPFTIAFGYHIKF
jgi:hypothetical protein